MAMATPQIPDTSSLSLCAEDLQGLPLAVECTLADGALEKATQHVRVHVGSVGILTPYLGSSSVFREELCSTIILLAQAQVSARHAS
jgi:hypothetical protein